MNPRTIFILALCAFCWGVVIYKLIERAPENNLRGGRVEAAHASETLAAQAERSATRPEQVASGRRVPPASQSPIDAEAQRVINELVDTGMTPEEATARYRHRMDWATTQRVNRAQMPGVRTNVSAENQRLFEE